MDTADQLESQETWTDAVNQFTALQLAIHRLDANVRTSSRPGVQAGRGNSIQVRHPTGARLTRRRPLAKPSTRRHTRR
jgi:hypothetical protein